MIFQLPKRLRNRQTSYRGYRACARRTQPRPGPVFAREALSRVLECQFIQIVLCHLQLEPKKSERLHKVSSLDACAAHARRELGLSNIHRGGATIRRALTGANRLASPPILPDDQERSNRAA